MHGDRSRERFKWGVASPAMRLGILVGVWEGSGAIWEAALS